MDKRQRSIISNFIFVVVITIAAILGLVNFKDYVNRAEAMRAMEHLGQIVQAYRQKHDAAPPEYYVDDIKKELEGGARLGELHYRARWIEFGATDDEVLAYARKRYRSSIFGSGYVVLRLDGRVEWMKDKQFKELMDKQQSTEERELSSQRF